MPAGLLAARGLAPVAEQDGRQPGEVPAIIQRALLKVGMPASAVPICPSEVDAALMALDWARPGDALVLLIHSSSARARMLEILESRRDA